MCLQLEYLMRWRSSLRANDSECFQNTPPLTPPALWEQVKLQLIVHKTQGAWQKHQLLLGIDEGKEEMVC